MGDIANDFDRSEFACKCECGFDTVDAELLDICQKIRDHTDRKMTINSGCRCWDYHCHIYKRDGLGEPPKGSYHLKSRAADVVVEGVSPQIVGELAIQYGARGVKVYKTFTHIDTRTGPRWYVTG